MAAINSIKKLQLKTQQEPYSGTWINLAVLSGACKQKWFEIWVFSLLILLFSSCCCSVWDVSCRFQGGFDAAVYQKNTFKKYFCVALCFCRARPWSGGSHPAACHLGPGGDGPLQQQTQTEAGPPQPGSRCADVTQPKTLTQRGRLSKYNHCKDSEAFSRHIDTHLYPACQSCLYSLWVSRRAPYLDGTSRCG